MPDRENNSKDIAQQLKALQQSYAAELPVKTDEIERYWQCLVNDGWDSELVATIHRKSHSLAGSGASFGFPEVSRTARKLEVALKTMKESGSIPDDKSCSEIQHYINDLKKCIQPESETRTADTTTATNDSQLVFIFDTTNKASTNTRSELDKFGYRTETYSELASLEEKLKETMPACIIAYLCDADAEAELAKLRRNSPKTLPLIFICENDDIKTRLAAVRAGSSAFLTLGSDISQLIDSIEKFNPAVKKDPYRVLIVDDSEALAMQYAYILNQAGMDSEYVTDPLLVNDKLSSFRPELLLVDMYMPKYTGTELAKVLRQHDTYVGIPIVFLSAETDIEKQIDAMREGGDDFLTKPIHPDHLISSVANRIERYRVLRTMMENDSLTGLLNHTRTKQRLDIELSRANRENHKLTFAMLDLDNFKQVNDSHGHAVGDQVLKMLSRVLQQRLRRTDIIGRYGGEEFAVILPDSDLQSSSMLMDKVREIFANLPIHTNDTVLKVTFSCGLASYPEHGDASALIHAADEALYSAKKAGKNCVKVSAITK